MSAQSILPPVSEETMKILEDADKSYGDGELDVALDLWRRLDVDQQEAHALGLNDNDLSYVLFCIGKCLKEKGDYYDAISYFQKSEALINKLYERHIGFVPYLYSATANSYIGIGEYNKALELGKKRLNLMIRKYGNESPELLDPYIFLYYTYRLTSDLPQALDVLNKYFKLYFKVGQEPESYDDFVDLMLQHASLSYMLNQLDNAFEICKTIEMLGDEYEIDKKFRLRCYNFMFNILSEKDTEEAPAYIGKAVELLEEFTEEEMACDDVMTAMNNVAVFYMDENPQEALDIFSSLAEYFKEKGGKGNAGYALVCNNIGCIIGLEDEESIVFFDEAFHLAYSQRGWDVAKALMFGYNWIFSLQYAGRVEEITVALREINDVASSRLNDSFVGLSERNRSLYWNQVKSWYEEILPYFAVTLQLPEVWGILYDGILQSRSILLSSAMSLSALVEQSDNPTLKRLYAQSSELNSIEGSEGLVEMLQQRLLNEVKDYGNFMDLFAVDHNKVQISLTDQDIAVEFVRYSVNSGGDVENASELNDEGIDVGGYEEIRYLALIQTSDREYPLGVDICSENELDDWNLENLYKIIWTPILEYAGDVNRVYFSPDGKIFSLPVEYAIDSDGVLMNEKLDIFRLSSTREIVYKKNAYVNDIALFGGMKFDLSVDDMVADASQYRDATADMVKTRGSRGAISLLKPLPATKVEIEKIQAAVDSISSGNMYVSIFSGERATEAAFKSYSGKGIGILHVATHGFYDSDIMANSDDLQLEADIINFEQENMRRSGILFSGADNVRMEEPVPTEVEDGILDSYEITNLDFHKTDLVVLSACQTALGAVSGDGVFGLQRGFKKAGVNSILMSLWKVDDDATCCFMTEFYKHLLSGSSYYDKVNALKMAQNAVRNIPRWADPQYWGAFILLDALK